MKFGRCLKFMGLKIKGFTTNIFRKLCQKKLLPYYKRVIAVFIILLALGTWHLSENKSFALVGDLPVASTPTEYPTEFYLKIPKINIETPIVADVDGADKDAYFKALENGVSHMKNTAKPGEGSNIFIFGHSSFYENLPGNFKEIFKTLDQLSTGDEIIIWYNSKEYKYKVTETKVVLPEEVSVAKATPTEQLTLSTCYPVGTTQSRLIIIASPML